MNARYDPKSDDAATGRQIATDAFMSLHSGDKSTQEVSVSLVQTVAKCRADSTDEEFNSLLFGAFSELLTFAGTNS